MGYLQRYTVPVLSALALIYALFAGLRTVGDMDLGWQLGTGRWIIQNHALPSTDVLSYTARGTEWIYPALSQLLFYGSYLLGGYALLSWIGAAACVLTVCLLLHKARIATTVLAIVAVPMIAWRTQPRAEMFTEVLFAAFVAILWQYHANGKGRLWLLPLLMALWVNLHLGFVAGLGMCGAYVILELENMIAPSRRAGTILRLRRAAPWLGLTVLATLLNPWGPRLYLAIARQNEILRIHSRWIAEWAPLRITGAILAGSFAWRDPRNDLYWLLAAALLATICAVYLRKAAAALLLCAAIYFVLHAVRFQGPFASVVVVIGGALISAAFAQLASEVKISATMARIGTTALLATAMVMVAFRVADLVTDRYYLRSAETFSLFGAGESPLFPEAAAAFVGREKLPGNLFNDYNSGGLVAWRLGPTYSDYIDGRSVPFGPELFLNSEKLLSQSPDSQDWQREAQGKNINTILVSLDHELGSVLPALDKFCTSAQWRPVFLDAYGAVFVRVTASNVNHIDCSKVEFNLAPQGAEDRVRAQRFRYYLNAASILIVLDRNLEALDTLSRAEQIFPDNAYLHYAKGSALQALGRSPEAEQQLSAAVELGSEDAALGLARTYGEHGRHAEQASVLRRAAERSSQPHWLYLHLGNAYIAMGQSQKALRSFDEAEKNSPFVHEADELGKAFRAQLEEGRSRAAE
jgi:tetratricopeptide (TPR) repeat protein